MTPTRQKADAIDQQAADWVARQDAGALSADEAAELLAWLGGDARCLGAYARARAVYVSPRLDAAMGVRRMPDAAWTRRGFMAAMAASVVAAAVYVVRSAKAPASQSYESMLGEIRRIPLADGSVITLNTNSAVSVDYRKNIRLVRLVRGEAFFEVAKAPQRPFIVMGPITQVRTVGTSYSVRLVKPGEMQVQVASGRVALESPPSPLALSLMSWSNVWPDATPDDKSHVFVDASQVASVRLADETGDSGVVQISIAAVPADAVAQALMWRQGQLSFAGESLADAVAEFARYSDRKIVIRDAALAKKHISGLFAAHDPEGFARAAAMSLSASINVKNDTIIMSK